MANQVRMATIQAILSLRARRWSYRRIARELGVHRETVARYVRSAGSKPAKAPLDSSGESAEAPLGEALPSRSTCEPWRDFVERQLAAGQTAQRIYQDLVSEQGFTGSYYSVRRFVRALGAASPLPFRRIETAAGEEAQVDFGTGGPVVGPDGKRRRTHVFRIVLSHSRKGYSEVTYRQTTEDFLLALENAFRHFGGVPKTLVIDNLKAAVKHPDWFDPELTPKVAAFADHYGTVVLPTKPYMPRHKGKVEAGVKFVQNNGLKGRRFASLAEQNQHLREWEARIADTRIHGTTRKQVGPCFQEVERASLLPLPREPFPSFHEAQRSVNRDGHVEVGKAYYSAPPEYVGRRVWVRWDARVVRIFNQRFEQIALHPRHEPGRFSTLGQHLPNEKRNAVERGAEWLLTKVRRIGPESARWSEAMLAERGVAGVRVLQGLLALTSRHPAEALEQACAVARSAGEYRLRTVRKLVGRQAPWQEEFEFASEHALIRPLADYARFVRQALTQGAASRRGFTRHGRTIESVLISGTAHEKSPDDRDRRGLRVIHPPWSGYSSSGCTPAEPDSASPNTTSLAQ